MTLLTRRFLRQAGSITSQRSLWTRVSSTAPTLKACIDQCLADLPLDNKKGQPSPTVCFALISKSFQGDDYTAAIKDLTHRWGNNNTTSVMGCIVDRTASTGDDGSDGHGVNLLVGYDEHIQPFQVFDSPQRQKARSISVGRWGQVHDFDRFKYEDNTLDTLGWDSFQTISRPPQQHVHVLDNDDSTDSSSKNQQQPSFILMASDHEPDQVLHSLDQVYPTTPKLGIIGASTPFVTGEPYTFFYQGQIMHAGMIGFAAYQSSTSLISQVTVRHPDLEPLGSTFEITRARGNIILDLDDQGATRRLLDLIHQGKVAKDEAFYLSMQSDNQHEDSVVARITSGDPSRGNMAVDTTLDLHVGQKVQFMKRKAVTEGALEPRDLLNSCNDHSMVFGVVDLDHTIDAMGLAKTTNISNSHSSKHQVFGATSENGMIVGKPGRPSRLVQVPFSIITVD
ncbi:hypothetical protein BCR42DRAFT_492992 [Absidia repens]|uniref:FIST domain-containing protein n=1 Tax=Absidia repens TaxID=90262 RepID=A0A1X2IDC7_9FUNG|nr:hypothetical protein BCR42DRAFT_492992 [Absidia repens]